MQVKPSRTLWGSWAPGGPFNQLLIREGRSSQETIVLPWDRTQVLPQEIVPDAWGREGCKQDPRSPCSAPSLLFFPNSEAQLSFSTVAFGGLASPSQSQLVGTMSPEKPQVGTVG